MGRRAGYIAMIDAAYRTDLREDEWLEGLLAAAVPLIDFGDGVAAVAYRASPSSGLELTGIAATANMRSFEPASRGYLGDSEVPMIGRMFQRTDAHFLRRDVAGAPSDHPAAFEYWSELGVHEAFSVVGYDASGYGVMISSLAPKDARMPPKRRGLLRRVAAHVASAVRLRKAPPASEPGDIDDAGVEALLSPDGRIVEANERVRADQGKALERAARLLTGARSLRQSEPDSVLAWHALWSGRWTLVDQERRDGRCFLVAKRNEPQLAEPKALTLRERQVLHYIQMGHSQKFIAFELGIRPSTVAGHVASAESKLGVSTTTELLNLHADPGIPAPSPSEALAEAPPEGLAAGTVTSGGDEFGVFSFPVRPMDQQTGLTPSEQAVVELALAGKRTKAIAQARGVSERTVANQLQSAYGKLGVTTRSELAIRFR